MDTGSLQTLVEQVRAGSRDARDRLFELLYEQLRAQARFALARGQRRSLDTTGVVHEAYLRLAKAERLEPVDRAHFLRIAAHAMRNVLVDHARRRLAVKRGGTAKHVDLDAIEVSGAESAERLVALDEALSRLGKQDERLVQVVQLRFFAGQSVSQTADALGISERTVKRDWRLARAILHAALTDTESAREKGP